MLEVVATTPSSPLGTLVVVALDILPRDGEGFGCASTRSRGPDIATLFYTPKAGGFPTGRNLRFVYGRILMCLFLSLGWPSRPAGIFPHCGVLMKRVFFFLSLVVCLVLPGVSRADEGMWLYNAVPKDKLKAKYGF